MKKSEPLDGIVAVVDPVAVDYVGIPVKLISDPGQTGHRSERSDAGAGL